MDISILPQLVTASQVCGAVSNAAATAIGAPELEGISVFHGAGDLGSTTVGATVCAGLGIQSAYAYIGTSGWVARTVAEGEPAAHRWRLCDCKQALSPIRQRICDCSVVHQPLPSTEKREIAGGLARGESGSCA